MNYFTTRETHLFPSFRLDVKEQEKLNRFLLLLDRSEVAELFPLKDMNEIKSGGRPHYSYHDLFAVILYGFAFSSGTLRDLEDSCRFDLRYIYLMQENMPSYVVFAEMINTFILPNRKEIFKRILKAILKETGVTVEDLFIDGSKFEADANKYKFVWKPTTYHLNLSDKIRFLLNEAGLSRSVPEKGILPSSLIADKLTVLIAKAKEDTSLKKKCDLLYVHLIKSLEYEEKERICGENRNSYYKTDHDATAMTLKQDYYSGLASNMHAAYNVQLSVARGIICSYYVSQSRNDIDDFIPVLKAFYDNTGFYPERVCADAGYGSLKNYRFLKEKRIGNYVKYYSFEGNVSGKNPDCCELKEDHTLICLNGAEGVRIDIKNRHPRKAGSLFYKVEGCASCAFSAYCKRYMNKKDEDFKIFEVQEELTFYKQEAFNNLLTPKGIEMRVNRSSQVEGAFGVIKEDMDYTRLRRTSLEKVETEMMLTFLGYNIRKLFRFYSGKAKFNYWKAPEGLRSEKKKKPSAKRLSNKALKIRKKSVNEKAKEYKY
jgi:transposase